MRTKRKSLHKPQSLTVRDYKDSIKPYYNPYTSTKQSEYLEQFIWFDCRIVKRGDKVIHRSSVLGDPPQFHLDMIQRAKEEEKQSQALEDTQEYRGVVKEVYKKPWWRFWK